MKFVRKSRDPPFVEDVGVYSVVDGYVLVGFVYINTWKNVMQVGLTDSKDVEFKF